MGFWQNQCYLECLIKHFVSLVNYLFDPHKSGYSCEYTSLQCIKLYLSGLDTLFEYKLDINFLNITADISQCYAKTTHNFTSTQTITIHLFKTYAVYIYIYMYTSHVILSRGIKDETLIGVHTCITNKELSYFTILRCLHVFMHFQFSIFSHDFALKFLSVPSKS